MSDLKFGEVTEKIIGAALRVHNTPGCGFQVVIYQRAPELELKAMQLPYAREFETPVCYLNQNTGTRRVDFFVKNKIGVELIALTKLEDVHLAQAINHLEAYNLAISLLVNSGSKRLKFHRFTNKKYNSSVVSHPVLSRASHPFQTSRLRK